MARPTARRRAAERRAAAPAVAAERDARVRAAIDADFIGSYADFALVVCDDCGLEQTAHDSPCLVCGCTTGTTSPRHEITLLGLANPAAVDDTESVRETQQRR